MPPLSPDDAKARNPLRVVVADDNADLSRVLGEVIDCEPDLACVARGAAADRVFEATRAAGAHVLLLDVLRARIRTAGRSDADARPR